MPTVRAILGSVLLLAKAAGSQVRGGVAVDVDGTVYPGASGVARLLRYSPAAYAVFALLIAHPGKLAPWPVYWAALAVPVLCLPLTRSGARGFKDCRLPTSPP